jgi:hypothetical protein
MRNRITPAVLLGAALAAASGWTAGCGYEAGAWRDPPPVRVGGYSSESLYRPDVRTVAVPVFTASRSLFRRGLELQLTEDVIRQIETRTPYRIAPRDRADTLLEVEVLDLTERVLSKTPDNRVREMEVTVYVRAVWRDLRSGEVLRRAPRLSETGTFVAVAGETVPSGTATAFERLTERIVELMERDF